MSVTVDVAGVEQAFAARLGTEVRVTRLVQTFPGQSQETWLVDATVGGEERGFVLRVNPPGGGIVPMPLEREWKVYERLARTEIPVGEPLWFDEDPSCFGGRPYFVRVLVPGGTDIPGLRDDTDEGRALRRQVAFEHAEHLARLHTLDWATHGFGEILDVPDDPAHAVRMEFDTWRAIWDEVRPDPMPMMTIAFDWLESHLPTSAPRVSLLKGNNGLSEEIWKDGHIAALSDWELASLGDPAQDWAFSQGMLALWDAEETLAHYETCAGFALDRDNLAFWTVWTSAKAICCTAAGLTGFLDGRDLRPVLPTIGFGQVHLMVQLFAQLVTMSLADAAALVGALAARQLDQPASGGAA